MSAVLTASLMYSDWNLECYVFCNVMLCAMLCYVNILAVVLELASIIFLVMIGILFFYVIISH